MATTLVCGQPGAGKTSLTVERIMLPHFASDPRSFDRNSAEPGEGIVVTNVPVNRERWVEEFGEEAVSERLITFPEFIEDEEVGERRPFTKWEDFEPLLELRDKHGRAPLFVIDEAHEVIPKGLRFLINKQTGQREDTFPNKLLLLFTRQRHYLASFALVTQDPFSMAPDILKQVHSSLYVENAETKGRSHAYTVKIWNKAPPRNYQDCPFAKCDDGESKPKRYNPSTQSFFISNSKNTDAPGGRALEGRYRHARSIWKRPLVMAIPFLLAFIVWQGYKVMNFGEDTPDRLAQPEVKLALPQPSTPVPAAPENLDTRTEFSAADVVDLPSLERDTALADQRKMETQVSTWLYSALSEYQGRVGPIVATNYPQFDGTRYAHLTDYAAHWGYAIDPVSCGWRLTRPDNVRHIYDPECLGAAHHATVAATIRSSSSSAPRMERSDTGAATPAPASATSAAYGAD